MTRHNNLVLFITLVVYIYRDVWPLATYTEIPLDESEGALLWTKLVVLFTTAVIIPLVIPRQYVPVDPKVITASTVMIRTSGTERVHSTRRRRRTLSRRHLFFPWLCIVFWTLSCSRPTEYRIYLMSGCLPLRTTIILNTFVRRLFQ